MRDTTLATPDIVPEREISAETLRYWIVPHTHWDREWYLPLEHFRMLLARTVDELIDVLEQDERLVFTLDGQSIVLEDYLSLRPHQETRLRRLIGDGRIAIGPSYLLPDGFIASGETHVRNLLMGRRVCERFGVHPMDAGYIPDTFGHIAQLPQLLRGFGLDTFLFQRGLGDETAALGAAFTWVAPDGSSVLALPILDGYCNLRDFGRWTWSGQRDFVDESVRGDLAVQLVRETVDRSIERIRSSELHEMLLCNGMDHYPIQRDLPDLVEVCRKRLPGATFEIGTFEQFAHAARRDLNGSPLPTWHGELVGGRNHQVTRSVLSTRMYLKQASADTERDLFVAEALASLAMLRWWTGGDVAGWRYPNAELWHAWRELLTTHPHDSICGCSIDDVHRAMLQRFAHARQVADRVRSEALAALAGTTEPWSYRSTPSDEQTLVNPLPWCRRDVAELPIPPLMQRSSSLVAETPNGPRPVRIERRGADAVARFAAELDGFGSMPVRLRIGAHRREDGRADDGATVASDRYVVTFDPDSSTLTIVDLRAGRSHRGLHMFESVADRGDEYNFDGVPGDAPWTSVGCEARARVLYADDVAAAMRITFAVRLPRSLDADRRARVRTTVPCRIETTLRIAAGVNRIDFESVVDNRASDHRLRVVFPAPDSDMSMRSEGHFAVLEHPSRQVWTEGEWVEVPQHTHHTSGMVSAGALTLFADGLPEYEGIPNNDGGVDIALTLLRCIGWLSRGDLACRPFNAGPSIPTPDAQCHGMHRFRYAIRFDDPGASSADLVRAAHEFRYPLVPGPAGVRTDGLLDMRGEEFAMSALKASEDGSGIVARLWNPDALRAATMSVDAAAGDLDQCRIDELEPTAIASGRVEIAPGAICTLRIRPPAEQHRH